MDAEHQEPPRIGPYVFVEEAPIGDDLLEALERRRRARRARAVWGLICFPSPLLVGVAVLLGAGPVARMGLGVASVLVMLGGLGVAAWYGTLHGTTVRQLRRGVVWRFELDRDELEGIDHPPALPESIEVLPEPLLLARIDEALTESDMPVTIGAGAWPPGVAPPPVVLGAGAIHP